MAVLAMMHDDLFELVMEGIGIGGTARLGEVASSLGGWGMGVG